jgi:hypothetical protein
MTALFHFLDLVLLVFFLMMSGYLFHEGSLKRARRQEIAEEARLREAAMVNAQLNAEHERMLAAQEAADKHRLMDTLVKSLEENPENATQVLLALKSKDLEKQIVSWEDHTNKALLADMRMVEPTPSEYGTTWKVPRLKDKPTRNDALDLVQEEGVRRG